ncbi:hydroxyacid dehydrogenase, partial [Patescibacteria group bacterium]|nr:hydroxyacid dehydrogenase [Patescibacteria group bacterium]
AHFIRMAKGFQMTVVAYDIYRNEQMATELGFKYVEFDELLNMSDIISLHIPYNEQTHHIINKENINKIKKGAYLINTARGGLVETQALILALEQGILAGAGLDVVEEEGSMGGDVEILIDEHPNPEALQTLLANQYLIDHPRVIIVPHNAFNTQEAIERILNTTIENIKNATEDTPINVVNK